MVVHGPGPWTRDPNPEPARVTNPFPVPAAQPRGWSPSCPSRRVGGAPHSSVRLAFLLPASDITAQAVLLTRMSPTRRLGGALDGSVPRSGIGHEGCELGATFGTVLRGTGRQPPDGPLAAGRGNARCGALRRRQVHRL